MDMSSDRLTKMVATVSPVSPPIVSPPTPTPSSADDAAAIRRVQTNNHLRASQSNPNSRKVSVASAVTNSSVETAFRGSVNSGKPSFWSVPESVRSLVGSSAHISEAPPTAASATAVNGHSRSEAARKKVGVDAETNNLANASPKSPSPTRRKATPLGWKPLQLDGCEMETSEHSQRPLLPKRRKLKKQQKISPESTSSDAEFQPPSEPGITRSKRGDSRECCFQLVVLVRLIYEISLYHRFLLCLGVVTAIGAGCTLPIVNIILGQLVYDITKFYTISTPNDPVRRELVSTIHAAVFHFIYLGAARFVLGYGTSILFQKISLQITAAFRERHLESLLSHPLSIHDALPPGWTNNALTITTEYLQVGFESHLPLLLTTSSMIISAMVVAFVYNWKLASIVFAALVPMAVIYALSSSPIDRVMSTIKHINSRACEIVLEGVSIAATIIAFEAQKKVTSKYTNCLQQSSPFGNKITRLISMQQATFALIVFSTNSLAVYYGMRLYVNHEMSDIGTLVTVFGSMIVVVTSISLFNQPIQSLALAMDYASFLFDFIDIPSPKLDGSERSNVFDFGDIVFKDVSLSYASRPNVKALDNVNITIPQGKTTAIVGPQGSGKSSIVALIQRWYELDARPLHSPFLCNGKIFCGVSSLTDLDVRYWRSQIGLVARDSHFFDGTIQENIEYGLVGSGLEHASAEIKRELVEKACADALALDFISELPNGLQTKFKDCEPTLTIGQKQLIAIARAIIRSPKLLILDDVTSGLGGREETDVLRAMARAAKNQTTLKLAQHLKAAFDADKTIVLAGGSVVQTGSSFVELIQAADGPYAKLFFAQRLDPENQITIERPSTWWRRKSGLVPLMLEGFEFTENREWELNMRRGLDLMSSYADKSSATDTNQPSGLTGFCSLFFKDKGELWPWYYLLGVGAMVIGAASALQSYLFAQQIVNFFLEPQILQERVGFWCLMLLATAGASSLGYLCSTWATTHLSFKLFEALRRECFSDCINQPVPFFDEVSNNSEILTAAITTDSDYLQRLLSSTVGTLMVLIFNALGNIAICLYFGWELTSIAIGTALPLVALSTFLRIRDNIHTKQFNTRGRDEATRFATETLAASRTIISLTIEKIIIRKYHSFLQAHNRRSCHRRMIAYMLLCLGDSLPLFWIAFVLWYGIRLIETHRYQMLEFLVILFSTIQQGMAIIQCLNTSSSIADAMTAAKRMISRKPKSSGGASFEGDSSRPDSEKGKGKFDVELLNVWLKYPKREVSVLTGLNIKINQGEVIAIIGATGSGKTSVLSLLERFYEPTRGMITANGVNIKHQKPEDYRRSVSIISQEPQLMSDTLRNNIVLGMPADTSEEKVYEAGRAAGIHDLASSLPEGYDTLLGCHGTILSTSQKVRVALARAIIRNPKLLLLDEVTCGLTNEEASALKDTIDQLRENRSVVMATSRVDVAQPANMIYVIQEGVVVEVGSHNQLMEKKNVYYYMSVAQALG
ncbi:ABC transporter B family member 4 [Ceratocystis fimbriata CBS 114723]|uniref:ABC transporter B family member 4 n=1 Tax=Ceratocystis fimbriata CBS 114723 TaxID=1035309 RepID=A0A2C5X247_9PEZI|nr:ABC transporter B family member 4 [Ceratocystis fimbriata CBS 114723]